MASINRTVPHPTTQAYEPDTSASCPLVRMSACDSLARPSSKHDGFFIAALAARQARAAFAFARIDARNLPSASPKQVVLAVSARTRADLHPLAKKCVEGARESVKVGVARSESINRLDPMRAPSVITCTRVAGAFLALEFSVRSALAQGGCTLVLRLERPEPAWEAAAAELRPKLALDESDCQSVEVVVHEGAARVVFTTRDGRTAVRSIHEASELSPTVSALLVELPPRVENPPPPPPVLLTNREPHPARQSNPPAKSPHVLLNGAAGARVAGPSPLATATLGVGASLSLSGWDLGVAGTWCPSYVSLSDDPMRPATLSSLGAGVLVGRRGHVSRTVSLLGGVSLAAAFEHEHWDVVDGDGRTLEHETERGQMLVGAYGGVAFPSQWKTHFLSTLNVDLDATHAGTAATTVEGAPSLPWWGVSIAVGVESEVP